MAILLNSQPFCLQPVGIRNPVMFDLNYLFQSFKILPKVNKGISSIIIRVNGLTKTDKLKGVKQSLISFCLSHIHIHVIFLNFHFNSNTRIAGANQNSQLGTYNKTNLILKTTERMMYKVLSLYFLHLFPPLAAVSLLG